MGFLLSSIPFHFTVSINLLIYVISCHLVSRTLTTSYICFLAPLESALLPYMSNVYMQKYWFFEKCSSAAPTSTAHIIELFATKLFSSFIAISLCLLWRTSFFLRFPEIEKEEFITLQPYVSLLLQPCAKIFGCGTSHNSYSSILATNVHKQFDLYKYTSIND